MTTIYDFNIINNTTSNSVFFYTLGFLFIVTGISLLLTESSVHGILYLMLIFLYLTELTICLKMEFLGLIFIIIYIGAVCVLMLFHIKLIKTFVQRYENIHNKNLFLPLLLVSLIIPLMQIITLSLEKSTNITLSKKLILEKNNLNNSFFYWFDYFSSLKNINLKKTLNKFLSNPKTFEYKLPKLSVEDYELLKQPTPFFTFDDCISKINEIELINLFKSEGPFSLETFKYYKHLDTIKTLNTFSLKNNIENLNEILLVFNFQSEIRFSQNFDKDELEGLSIMFNLAKEKEALDIYELLLYQALNEIRLMRHEMLFKLIFPNRASKNFSNYFFDNININNTNFYEFFLPKKIHKNFSNYFFDNINVNKIKLNDFFFLSKKRDYSDFILNNNISFNYTKWIDLLENINNTQILGFLIFNIYFLALIIGSLILLVAMIGSIFLTLTEKREKKVQKLSDQLFEKFNTLNLKKKKKK